MAIELFEKYLSAISDPSQRARLEEILDWVAGEFPSLKPRVAWNQPMFTDHGTFIIGFSITKNHISVSPEKDDMDRFASEIEAFGYGHTSYLFRIKWNEEVNFALLKKMIAFTIEDKAECTTFWRK